MGLELQPWQGIGIPVALISFISLASFYVFHKHSAELHLAPLGQLWFQLSVMLICFYYYKAIVTPPGSPPADYKPSRTQWARYCKKCERYKPERCHHCKICKRCVLRMDHHCPWTANCVGNDNYLYFLKFLFWVVQTTAISSFYLTKQLLHYWRDRDLPAYLVSRLDLTLVIVAAPLSWLVLFSVGVLAARSCYFLASGMTQIESWEYERIESSIESPHLLRKLERNLQLFFGAPQSSGGAPSSGDRLLKQLQGDEISIDDINFPYDISLWANVVNAIGSPVSWLCLTHSPACDGLSFKKNEYCLDNDISSLPWPPDGSHQHQHLQGVEDEVIQDNELLVKNRNWQRGWKNDFGENIADFGVDVDLE